MCRDTGTGVYVFIYLKIMACTSANVIALPFIAQSVPGTELMALFHSVLPVTLEGGRDRLHFIDKETEAQKG